MKTGNGIDLLLHGLLAALLVVGWFALVEASHTLWVQIALGWLGFVVVALYFRWLLKHKAGPRPHR